MTGIKESARVNDVIVVLKVATLLFFVAVGAFFVKPANWHPFFPGGFSGVWTGASLIFFAYIGFDAISTAAEECKDPGRDMPRGILGSLAVCTRPLRRGGARPLRDDPVHASSWAWPTRSPRRSPT